MCFQELEYWMAVNGPQAWHVLGDLVHQLWFFRRSKKWQAAEDRAFGGWLAGKSFCTPANRTRIIIPLLLAKIGDLHHDKGGDASFTYGLQVNFCKVCSFSTCWAQPMRSGYPLRSSSFILLFLKTPHTTTIGVSVLFCDERWYDAFSFMLMHNLLSCECATGAFSLNFQVMANIHPFQHNCQE